MFGRSTIDVRALRSTIIDRQLVKAGDVLAVAPTEAALALQTQAGELVRVEDGKAVADATTRELQRQARACRAWRQQ